MHGIPCRAVTARGVVRRAHLPQRASLLVAGCARRSAGQTKARGSRRLQLELRLRVGSPFPAFGQWQHRLQRHGKRRHRTLYAQRKNTVARRPQHRQGACRLLGTEQAVGPPPARDTPGTARWRLEQSRTAHLLQFQQHRTLRGHRRAPIPFRIFHHHGRAVCGNGLGRIRREALPPCPFARLRLRQGQFRGTRRRILRAHHLCVLSCQRDGGAFLRFAARQAATADYLYPQPRGRGQIHLRRSGTAHLRRAA